MSLDLAAARSKPAPKWFSGVCDSLVKKIHFWDLTYEQGTVFATRDFLDFDGTIKKIPTRRGHKIPFSYQELCHLHRIISAFDGTAELAKDIETFRDFVWVNGKLLPGGNRLAEIVCYHEHVKQMFKLLMLSKDAPKVAALEKAIEDAKTGAQDLFEA